MQRWNLALRYLAYVGMGSTLASILWSLIGSDFELAFITDKGVEQLNRNDFTWSQRFAIVALLGMPYSCWLWSMWQIVRLSWCFERGELLTKGVIDCLGKFGWGLLGLAITELIAAPAVNAYLVYLQKAGWMKDLWHVLLDGGLWGTFMSAVLVNVIVRIFKVGTELREEAELTV